MVGMLKRLSIVFIALAVFACARHDDFPPSPSQIGFIESPRPDTLIVTLLDSANVDYRLDWTISDESAVDYYRVYMEILVLGVVMDTTSARTYRPQPGLPYLSFGVSSVSLGNVESSIVTEPAF